MKKIIQAIRNWCLQRSFQYQKQTAVQKRRFIIICTAVFAAILTISVFISMKNSAAEEDEPFYAPEKITINSPIPIEELFLPGEPDFIPGVIQEREKRLSWTEDDAAEFWQDPLRFGEEQWREKIEAAVNELLERVP